MIAGDVRSLHHASHINRTGNLKTLKFSALFGANASGKSTVIKAISFLKEAVVGRYLPIESIDEWCQFYPENRTKPSIFEIDLKIGNTIYTYGLAINLFEQRILGEWADKRDIDSNNAEIEILNRELDDTNKNKISPEEISQNKVIFHDLLDIFSDESKDNKNNTIISHVGHYSSSIKNTIIHSPNSQESIRDLLTIYSWFAGTLQIIKPLPIGNYSQNEQDAEKTTREIEAIMQRKVNLEDIDYLACRLGLGVTGINTSLMTEREITETFTQEQLAKYEDYFPNLRAAKNNRELEREDLILLQKCDDFQNMRDSKISYLSDLFKSIEKQESQRLGAEILSKSSLTHDDFLKMREILEKEEKQLLTDIKNKCHPYKDNQAEDKDRIQPIDESEYLLTETYVRFTQLTKAIQDLDSSESQINALNKEIDQLKNKRKIIRNQLDKELLEQSKKADSYKHLTGTLIPLDNALIFCSDDEKNPCTKKIEFLHGINKSQFSYGYESDGTKRMMELIEIICAAKYGAKRTYIIDEIDRSLHPQLTYRLVKEFLNATQENGETQLFITTHEAHILEQSLIRHDEIWILDKGKDGSSSLYSLSDFKYEHWPGKDIVSRYLNGKYGGVPLFDALFPMDESTDKNSDFSNLQRYDFTPSDDNKSDALSTNPKLSKMIELEKTHEALNKDEMVLK